MNVDFNILTKYFHGQISTADGFCHNVTDWPAPVWFVTHLHGDQYEVDQSADSTETNSAELQQAWDTQRVQV